MAASINKFPILKSCPGPQILYISAMKLVIALLLSPLLSFSQSKGDTKIIITTPDSTGLFNKVAMVLYESGYTLSKKDEALQFVSMNKQTRWAHVTANALVKGNTITLSGIFEATITVLDDPEPITYRGMKGSIFRTTFAELQAVADKIGGQISYSK